MYVMIKINVKKHKNIRRGVLFMFQVKRIDDIRELYHYYQKIEAPYYFRTSFEEWSKSLENDIDNQGKTMFAELYLLGAYEDDVLTGFVQYGLSAFGFNEQGEISDDIHFQIIRSLYYDKSNPDVGEALLQEVVGHFDLHERIYAFFHYFGMSCYARHGKLFEKYDYIGELLKKHGFVIEHENVYYSMEKITDGNVEVEIKWGQPTAGDIRCGELRLHEEWIGECEVHFLFVEKIAYLRWIYIDEKRQNQGLGSLCMQTLLAELKRAGYERLDTDTAMTNERAQHYYEKNGFKREGVTRSYYLS